MIIKKVCRQIRYVVYLPTITKVTLSDVNRLDFNKKEAFISIKIEIKVNVRGYSKSP